MFEKLDRIEDLVRQIRQAQAELNGEHNKVDAFDLARTLTDYTPSKIRFIELKEQAHARATSIRFKINNLKNELREEVSKL